MVAIIPTISALKSEAARNVEKYCLYAPAQFAAVITFSEAAATRYGSLHPQGFDKAHNPEQHVAIRVERRDQFRALLPQPLRPYCACRSCPLWLWARNFELKLFVKHLRITPLPCNEKGLSRYDGRLKVTGSTDRAPTTPL